MHETMSFYKKNSLFHLKKNGTKKSISKSVLNFFICLIKSSIDSKKSIQLHPCEIQTSALKLTVFFTLVLSFEFVYFDPQLINKLQISLI